MGGSKQQAGPRWETDRWTRLAHVERPLPGVLQALLRYWPSLGTASLRRRQDRSQFLGQKGDMQVSTFDTKTNTELEVAIYTDLPFVPGNSCNHLLTGWLSRVLAYCQLCIRWTEPFPCLQLLSS